MLSIELIRSETETVQRSIENRGDFVDLGRVLELDEKRRSMIGTSDSLRARRNKTSREISKLRDKPQALIKDMRKVGTELRELDEQMRILERELDEYKELGIDIYHVESNNYIVSCRKYSNFFICIL